MEIICKVCGKRSIKSSTFALYCDPECRMRASMVKCQECNQRHPKILSKVGHVYESPNDKG